VAYRTDIGTRDRGGAIAAVIAIHAGLAFMVLHLSGKMDVPGIESAMRVFDLTQPPPPPPPPPPQQQTQQPKPKEKEGGSAPPNIRSQATPVEAPKRIRLERTAIGVTWATRNPLPLSDNLAPADAPQTLAPRSDESKSASTAMASADAAGTAAADRERRGVR